MKKRAVSLLLLGAMLAGTMLTGCSDAPDKVETTESAAAETVTDDGKVKDGLPGELNFDGSEVKLCAQLWMTIVKNPEAEFYVAETSGDVVDDAVYNRNRAVEERLNVKLSWNCIETTWDTRNDYLNYVSSSILAADDAFDATFGIVHLLPSIAINGNMLDLHELEYNDFDAAWWASGYNKTAQLGGKLYFATGDIVYGIYNNAYCMFFNRALVEDLALSDPYQLVEDGAWTVDRLRELCSSCCGDLNGNGETDEADRFGLVIEGGNQISGFEESCGVGIIEIAEDGKSAEYIFGSEHNANAVEKVNRLLHDSDGVLFKSLQTDIPASDYIFTDENTVFAGGWIGDTDYYRELNFDYGVLPYPKYDEAQQSYYTRLGTACHAVSVPATCQNTGRISAVLEALASEGYNSIRTAYCDTALKDKYSRDEKTKETVDLLFDTISVDFGTIYVYSLDGISDNFKNSLAPGCSTWASSCEKWRESVMKKVQTLLDT